MKIIKYNLCTLVNYGTEKEPLINEVLAAVEIGWNEVNEEIAKREAYNGEYAIEDDGTAEDETEMTLGTRVGNLETDSTEMKEALDMILNGVTE